MIVGIKCDLPLAVDLDTVKEYADSVGASLVLCSTEKGYGVNRVFETVVGVIGDKLFGESFVIEE